MRIGSDKDAVAVAERQGPAVANAQGRSERRKHISPETSRQLVHELRLHQVELERQNEALRRTQAELASARARYFDLYDQAPVGYCTVSTTEHILEANLTVAALLGLACSDMVGWPIRKFILAQDQDIYCQHHHKLSASGQPQSCELRLLRADGSHFWAHLKASFDSGPALTAGQMALRCSGWCWGTLTRAGWHRTGYGSATWRSRPCRRAF